MAQAITLLSVHTTTHMNTEFLGLWLHRMPYYVGTLKLAKTLTIPRTLEEHFSLLISYHYHSFVGIFLLALSCFLVVLLKT